MSIFWEVVVGGGWWWVYFWIVVGCGGFALGNEFILRSGEW